MTLELYRWYKSPKRSRAVLCFGDSIVSGNSRRNAEVVIQLFLFFFYTVVVRVIQGRGMCNIPVYCAPIVVENKAIRYVERPAWASWNSTVVKMFYEALSLSLSLYSVDSYTAKCFTIFKGIKKNETNDRNFLQKYNISVIYLELYKQWEALYYFHITKGE